MEEKQIHRLTRKKIMKEIGILKGGVDKEEKNSRGHFPSAIFQ
ncbi:hypothetical protein [Peribacillus sp. V2I11]|nr:hypothetical protein [Peribacillus sp. V2I11]MDQ0884893.1 hypothetical protein [Peribacillus sp. V2I11]